MDDFPGTPESSEESQAEPFLLPLSHKPSVSCTLSYPGHLRAVCCDLIGLCLWSVLVWMETGWCPLSVDTSPGDLDTVVHFLTFSGRNFLLDILKGLTG